MPSGRARGIDVVAFNRPLADRVDIRNANPPKPANNNKLTATKANRCLIETIFSQRLL
jgi:hypothetical protein